MTKDILYDKIISRIYIAFIICLIVMTKDGFEFLFFIQAFLISGVFLIGINFLNDEKYLTNFKINNSELEIDYRKNLNSKVLKTKLLVSSVVSVKFSTSDHFLSPFNKLKIKYKNEENLNYSISLKIRDIDSWLELINATKKTKHNK